MDRFDEPGKEIVRAQPVAKGMGHSPNRSLANLSKSVWIPGDDWIYIYDLSILVVDILWKTSTRSSRFLIWSRFKRPKIRSASHDIANREHVSRQPYRDTAALIDVL